MAASRLDEYFEVKDLIGKGGFGAVFHVKHKVDKMEYVLKLSEIPKQQENVLREVTTLAQLEHPHIVRYYNSWTEKAPDGWREKTVWSELKSSGSSSMEYRTDTFSADLSDRADPSSGHPIFKILKSSTALPHNPPTCLFIQTELCKEDTFRTWLQKTCEEKSRTKSQVLSFFKQILEALVYIHKKGFVHRDVKPPNIFFSRTDDNCLKIGDFGLVRTVAQPNGAPTGLDTTPNGSTDSYSTGRVAGTRPYMSPEQVKEEKCDQKSDMYSLGVILFELYCYVVTGSRRQVLLDLRSLKFPPQFEDQLPNVTNIVKLLLATDPAERPTADELSKNTFLQELEKEAEGVVPLLLQ